MSESRRPLDPREIIAGVLAAAFLFGFIIMFAWLLWLVWTDPRHLPPYVRTDIFTNVSTTLVGLVGGIAAARMGARAGRGHEFRTNFEWVYVIAYFILGMAALITTITQTSGGKSANLPEAVNNLGTVSFGLAIATVASYFGTD